MLEVKMSRATDYKNIWHNVTYYEKWKFWAKLKLLISLNLLVQPVFTHCSGVSIVEFEQVNTGWVICWLESDLSSSAMSKSSIGEAILISWLSKINLRSWYPLLFIINKDDFKFCWIYYQMITFVPIALQALISKLWLAMWPGLLYYNVSIVSHTLRLFLQ